MPSVLYTESLSYGYEESQEALYPPDVRGVAEKLDR
jgi:hypothetical protein